MYVLYVISGIEIGIHNLFILAIMFFSPKDASSTLRIIPKIQYRNSFVLLSLSHLGRSATCSSIASLSVIDSSRPRVYAPNNCFVLCSFILFDPKQALPKVQKYRYNIYASNLVVHLGCCGTYVLGIHLLHHHYCLLFMRLH